MSSVKPSLVLMVAMDDHGDFNTPQKSIDLTFRAVDFNSENECVLGLHIETHEKKWLSMFIEGREHIDALRRHCEMVLAHDAEARFSRERS